MLLRLVARLLPCLPRGVSLDVSQQSLGGPGGSVPPPAGLHVPEVQVSEHGVEERVQGAEVDGPPVRGPDGQVEQLVQADVLRHGVRPLKFG